MLSPGRTVRCARCSEEWVPLPTATTRRVVEQTEVLPPPASEPIAPPPLTAMDRLAAQPASLPRTSAALRAAWVASFVVLALLVWSSVAWRAELMHAWPPSIRVFDAIGLGPAPPAH